MSKINNRFYDELGQGWLDRLDHPVALLRAENAVRAPWIAKEIGQRIGPAGNLIDIGCGAGLLSNRLAALGYAVTGIDLSEPSLAIARASDITRKAKYLCADAYRLPFPDHSFDAAIATDVLEHVEEPKRLIAEASRILRPGGLFFFHTFNRNLWSYLLVIKGVDWLVPNAPPHMHVYPLFIKPEELKTFLQTNGLNAIDWRGLMPKFTLSSLKMLFQRKIPKNFTFQFCRSLKIGYCGLAVKNPYE